MPHDAPLPSVFPRANGGSLLARCVLRIGTEENVPAKGIFVIGSVAAVAAALVATAGVAGRGTTGLLLASAAVIALAVTAGAKGRG
jgi:hypothetical protein